MGVRCPRALRGLVASLWSAGRGKSPENSPAATADRRPAAKKVRKLPAQEEHPRSRCSSWAGVQVPHGAARDEHRRAGCSSCMMSIRRGDAHPGQVRMAPGRRPRMSICSPDAHPGTPPPPGRPAAREARRVGGSRHAAAAPACLEHPTRRASRAAGRPGVFPRCSGAWRNPAGGALRAPRRPPGATKCALARARGRPGASLGAPGRAQTRPGVPPRPRGASGIGDQQLIPKTGGGPGAGRNPPGGALRAPQEGRRPPLRRPSAIGHRPSGPAVPRPPALGAAQRGWAPRPAGRDKSPGNSPAATADRRPTAKKVRKLLAAGRCLPCRGAACMRRRGTATGAAPQF